MVDILEGKADNLTFTNRYTMPKVTILVNYGYMPDLKGISVKSGKLVGSLRIFLQAFAPLKGEVPCLDYFMFFI